MRSVSTTFRMIQSSIKTVVYRVGTADVNNHLPPVQNLELSTAHQARGYHLVDVCGRLRAGETVALTGQLRVHPQSTALITRTIFHQNLVMSTMGESHHAVHV